MPRTKISKKRNRENTNEDRINYMLKEIDTAVFSQIQEMDHNLLKSLDDVSSFINKCLGDYSNDLLNLTFRDIEAKIEQESIVSEQLTMHSASSEQLRIMNGTMMIARKESDEGYLTEGSAHGSTHTVRRSRSAQQLSHTPLKKAAKPALLTSKRNRMTPLNSSSASAVSTSHMSRSKYKTPLGNRTKAMSADRIGVVTPKIQNVNDPVAMLRYANVGETVISLTGSPIVIPGQMLDNRANVNIPTKSGMLVMRPTEGQAFMPEFINRIDADTLNHLKMLQKNLTAITQMAEKNF